MKDQRTRIEYITDSGNIKKKKEKANAKPTLLGQNKKRMGT